MQLLFDFWTTGGTLAFVTQVIHDLDWNSDGVALLMMRHGIHNRAALAKTLGLARSIVNRSFNEQWEGHPTKHLIAVMCSYFMVRMSDIVVEPMMTMRRLNNGHNVHKLNEAVSL